MNDIFNPAPASPVQVQSEAFVARRFSNYDGTEIGPSMEDGSFVSNKGLGKDESGSGIWGSVVDIVNSVSGTISSIWGTNDKTRAEYINQLYYKEQQTTRILIGIIVALVLLAFVFLIIKNKK
ncbi:MAG: hypothetical protein K6A94_12065 [Bacteroidales bacterium]|nr:hypothetical protein [Bacteroidales bacterium]